MSELDKIIERIAGGGTIDQTDQHAMGKANIKALIAEICEECDASPRYKQILENL